MKQLSFIAFLEPATGRNLEYQPLLKKNLIIFPSYILHEGPVNESKKNRLIVSFNIMGANVYSAYQAGSKA